MLKPVDYHKESEKNFASIFMTTKYCYVKLEITWAKIDTTNMSHIDFYIFLSKNIF